MGTSKRIRRILFDDYVFVRTYVGRDSGLLRRIDSVWDFADYLSLILEKRISTDRQTDFRPFLERNSILPNLTLIFII